MRITAIRLDRLRVPLDPPFPAAWDPVPRTVFPVTLVRVETNEGVVGIGSGDTMDGFEAFADLFLGQDPLAIERHFLNMISLMHPYMAHIPTISGIDIALWDLAGKAFGLPIHHLMGGKMRDRVPVYLHAANPEAAKKILAETKTRVLKVGLDYSDDSWSIKKGYEPTRPYHLHMTNDQVDDVVNFFAGFRKVLGKEVEVGLECHAHYDLETGIQICHQIEPYRPLFVEEPVPSDNVESMLRIRNNTRVPIAAGENIYTRYGFRPFLEKQALSIIQPDFTKAGGLFEGMKIANMAETYNVPVMPHGVCTPLGTLAITHVCGVIPNFLVQEFTHYQNKAFTELCEPVKLDAEGFLPVPDAPGIGVELNLENVRKHAVPGYPV